MKFMNLYFFIIAHAESDTQIIGLCSRFSFIVANPELKKGARYIKAIQHKLLSIFSLIRTVVVFVYLSSSMAFGLSFAKSSSLSNLYFLKQKMIFLEETFIFDLNFT